MNPWFLASPNAYAAARAAASGVAYAARFRGAGERRRDDAGVAYTARPAMLGKLAFVDRENDVAFNPSPSDAVAGRHFASARSTSRSLCMMSSARAICRANSGS